MSDKPWFFVDVFFGLCKAGGPARYIEMVQKDLKKQHIQIYTVYVYIKYMQHRIFIVHILRFGMVDS